MAKRHSPVPDSPVTDHICARPRSKELSGFVIVTILTIIAVLIGLSAWLRRR
jgi:hypothetical protein